MRGLPRSPRKEEMMGFGPGNDFKVERLAPIGSRLQQICADSLPRPLLNCLFAMENQVTASETELQKLNNDLEVQQDAIEQLQGDLDQQRGALRKQETQILKQNQILGSGAIKMLQQLKLIKK
jgi:hypothetical protein